MINEFLKVVFKVDTKEFEKSLKGVEGRLKNIGSNMESFGRNMSMKVTAPIVAFGATSVKAFNDQEKAEFKLRAALEANGRAVDALFSDYAKFASELQEVTVVGDEASLAMLQVAENMGLTGDNAKRAVRNAIGLSSAFGISTQSAMRYTAMLEQGDTTMLNRYIPTLRSVEDEAQRVAMAHDILANGFQTALAEANTFGGQIQQITNNFGDFREAVGAVIAESLSEYQDELKQLTVQLKALDAEQIRSKLNIAAFAAAIPLATWALGALIKNATILYGALKTLFLLVRAHPIGALATAMGLLSINALSAASDVRKLRADYKELTELGDEDFGDKELARLDVLIDDLTKRLQNFSFVGATTEDGIAALRGQYQQLENQLASLIERRAQLTFVERQAPAVDEIIPDIPTAPIKPKIQVLPPDDRIDLSLVEKSIQDSLDSIDFGFPVNSIGFMNEQIALLQTNMMSATDPATILQYQQAIERLQQRIAELTGQSVKLNATWFDFTETVNQFGTTVANSLASAIVNAKSLADTLQNIGKMLLSTAFQILIRGFLMGGLGGTGFLGSAGGLFGMLGITKVNDALITSSGDVIKFHPDDNILAMKDFSGIGGGQNIHVTVSGQLRGEDIFISGTRGQSRYSR